MKRHSSILLLLLITLTISGSCFGQGFPLTKNGTTTSRIVLAEKPRPADLYAADLLKNYVKKISGADLQVVTDKEPVIPFEIIIGYSNRTSAQEIQTPKVKLAPDGFMIKVEAEKIFILGGEHNGSIYAVVELLEKELGCRKYSPDTEYIPSVQSIILKTKLISDQPKALFRIVNGHFCKDETYKAWQRLDDIEDVFADGYYVHTFNRLIPWEKYFQSNPEYFALMNGKRIIDQLCLSNPKVLKLAIAKLKVEMAAQPHKNLWSVSQNDNFSYCQCPQCSKIIAEEGSPAGPIIRFVNKIAEQFPDKTISTLAYQYSRQAPKLSKPRENVQIMLCTIELNRSKSIESDPGSAQFLKDIIDWGKISNHIYLWDYTVNFSNHISPFPNLHVLQPNIQFFIKNGALEHFQQSNTDKGHEFSELKNYLIARLLWNPDADADSIVNEFLNGYYGAAAPFIRDYIDLLESEYKKSGQVLDIYGSPVWNADAALSAENMAIYNFLFNKAEKAVSAHDEALQHVKVARLPIQFAAMEIGKNDMFGVRGWYQEAQGKYHLRQPMKDMLEAFYLTCKNNGVRTLSEAGLSPDDYYKSTLRFINVQVENNKAFHKKVESTPLPSPKYSKGDMSTLSNGVQGANDYKVHWLGWEALDFQLSLDLEEITTASSIRMGTLYDPKSWILHPQSVKCEVSANGNDWKESGFIAVDGDQKKEEVTRTFNFTENLNNFRYIRLTVKGTKALPSWHPSAGGDSWVFVDEIVVEK
ncbi:MAG: DUF4838 domain-containing protein [Bacteroidales bacterium]|nr:DUF4838 domain-containing protein [Bacteroidales bacterium]